MKQPKPNRVNAPTTARPVRQRGVAPPRQRGITAVLSMMFLLIFGSLAAAMAIVSQGNLRTADSHIKINRSLAAAETGMGLLAYRLEQVTQGDPDDLTNFPGIYTTAGQIHDGTTDDPEGNAYDLWNRTAIALRDVLRAEVDNFPNGLDQPRVDYSLRGTDAFGRQIPVLIVPAVSLGDGEPVFSATIEAHPLPLSEQPSALGYDDPFYDRPPYDGSDPATGIDWDVSEAAPLDGRFIRIKVTGTDGTVRSNVSRTISMDFRLDKTIPYAVLSRSRVMIGRNVQIQGNVGSLFTETDKLNGHPIQIQSDFLGLSDPLDAIISPPSSAYPGGGTFHNELVVNDINGDNRINVNSPTETQNWPGGETGAKAADIDGDGFVSEFDYFLAEFDTDTVDGRVTLSEFTSGVDSSRQGTATQLFAMMDQRSATDPFDEPDTFIDAEDLYAKIRGSVSIKATASDWNTGLGDWAATGGTATPQYQDFLQGLVKPDFGDPPLTTADPALDVHSFDQKSFDTSSFAALATNTLTPSSGVANGASTPEYVAPGTGPDNFERVPYGAAFPYDWYDRPIHRNKVFNNLRIPMGTNALFDNCKFQGVTFIEVEADNGDENFNYVGMLESDGTEKHPDYDATVGGSLVNDTKPLGNNIRFNNCTFEGPIVSGQPDGNQPDQYTHVRNKVTFTGGTDFNFDAVTDDEDRALYERSSLLLPHMSVEMGTHYDPDDPNASSFDTEAEPIELSGAIVAGLIDIRGAVTLRGTLITTYLPVSGVTPVKGDTAPQFNTTLGYFDQDTGDLEAGGFTPDTGLGKIRLIYDPTLALPDGIDGPIELRPIETTYYEGR
ncbi:MAG: hypothetical protein AAF333_01485 [Planctomycetota bacterium]